MSIKKVLLSAFCVLVLTACTQKSQQNTVQTTPATSYALTEIAQHSGEQDCWLIVDDNVYDVTSFIPQHPGGKEIIKGCGKDASEMFHKEFEHNGAKAQSQLSALKIGVVSK